MGAPFTSEVAGAVARTATCGCGQLSIAVRGDPLGVGVCHCLLCQRRTGSVFAALATFAAPWEVAGTAAEHVHVGDQGARFTFRFCPRCGTSLFDTEDGVEGRVSVAVGCFGDPDFPPPTVSVYDSRRHGWVALPDDVERFARDPN